jgi:predicted AAA+ superfamily ATPase
MFCYGLKNFNGIQAQMLGMDDLSSAYKGAVIPHLITQELISLQQVSPNNPHFWVRERTQSNAEVDLVLVHSEFLIPVEIKSGSTGSLRSLHQFIDAADHPYAIRIYGGTFSIEKAITPNKKPYLLMNLPYYLGTQLPAYLTWIVQQQAV